MDDLLQVRGLHRLGVGGNPAVTVRFTWVCVRTVRESGGGGLKSQESCGNRIDRLRESGAVEVDCMMSLQSDSHVLATIE